MKQLILFVSFFALLSLTALQAQNEPTIEAKTAVKCQSSPEDKCCSFSCCSLADIQKFCQSSLRFNKSETVAEAQPTACTTIAKTETKPSTNIAKASFASSLSLFCPPGCCSMPCKPSKASNSDNVSTELVNVSKPAAIVEK